jgi:uncharacterized repeat protein (TIGR01451 family)
VLIRAAEAVRSPQIRTIPELALDGDRSAVITVHYNGAWSSQARNAFQHAVDIWASQLNSPEDIVVDAYWTSLPTGVLGAAGATTIHPVSGAPVSNTWYPVALGNAISEGDLNGSTAEIQAQFNKDFPDWYFGTDGNPAGDEYDFVSVVLHELCHGLGFFGSMRVEDGVGSWGYWDSTNTVLYPMIYDRFTENGSGQALLTAFPNNSTALATQLQGGDIFFDGPYANAFNGGVRPELYAPSTWQQGSSYSHVDEIYDSTSDALMTYAIYNGEVNHLAGPIVQGMFKDMGWTFNPHLQITSRVMGSAVGEPGAPVTFTLSVANTGAAIATGVVVTDDLPTEIESPSWAASSSLTGISERGGTSYAWDLPDLGPGATGVITIYGTLASPLPSQYVIANQATIDTVEAEADLSDNTTSMIVLIEPLQAFLPMVLGR